MKQPIAHWPKSVRLVVSTLAVALGSNSTAVARSSAEAPPSPSQEASKQQRSPEVAPEPRAEGKTTGQFEKHADAKAASDGATGESTGGGVTQLLQPPADRIESTAAVPPAEVAVTTLDARSMPVPGVALELVRDRQSISEGNASSRRETSTDASGKARFDNIPTGSDSQYRVVAIVDGKRFGTRAFSMEPRRGTSVVLHVYPLVKDFKQALIAGRTFVFVEPRDQVLAFEFVQQFHNLGQSVLDADAIALRLPSGWKAFAANQADPDLSITKTDQGVSLVGTIAPGQHSVAFTFQIPSANRERVELELELWPNTAEIQVATLARPGLELMVDGFPNPNVMTSNSRQPWLVTGQSFTRAASAPQNIHLQIAGLPVVGVGRWVAVAGAASLALGALWSVLRREKFRRSDVEGHRAASARIVAELAALQQAHRAGHVGDETFAATREILLSAFVRLEREIATS